MIDPDSVRKVLLIASRYKQEAPACAARLRKVLQDHGKEVVDGSNAGDLPALLDSVDLAIAIGGDGTIISTARRMGESPVPTVGVNIGKLGFLAELKEEDVFRWLEGDDSSLMVVPRMMLRCRLRRRGHEAIHFALNDAVLQQGVLTRLLTIDMWVGDQHATQYHGDGVIISTPVGSTAYSLSLGGPILTPQLKAFIVTPIAPHSLTNRPIVIQGTETLRFRLQEASEETAMVFDGQEKEDMDVESEVLIERSAHDFPLVSHGRRNYYGLLQAKLNWSTAPNYGPTDTTGETK